ncbi:MAG: FecR family protein [Campylobacterota bacterium]
MKRFWIVMLLAGWIEISSAAEAGVQALVWAQKERDGAMAAVSSAEKRLEAAQSDLRVAQAVQNDPQTAKDPDASAVAREAVRVSHQGVREAEGLLERARVLLRKKEHFLRSVREAASSGKGNEGIFIPTGGEVKRSWNGVVSDADTPALLRAGERVDVGRGGSAKLFVAGGDAEVDVGENSSFSVNREGEGGFEALLSDGVAHVKAKLKHYFGKKFEVRTPAAVCAVRGTEFTLSHHSWGSRIEVFEGTVSVRTPSSQTVIEVHAAQGCDILNDKGVQPPTALKDRQGGAHDPR